MAEDLKSLKKVVGQKQSKKAIKDGLARFCHVARDAQDKVIAPILEICAETGVPVGREYTMQELGEMCGIDVGASVVTLL